MMDRIICGDALEELKKMPDNSIDLIVTDPPYGYSFMGKDWDKVVIGVPYWKEMLRVLKSGAFAFIMSAPRQDVLSRAIVNLQDAGFETGFSSIYWAYASGFPKASNIGKMVDKRLGNKRKDLGKKDGTYSDIRRDKKTGQDGLHGGVATERPRVIVRNTKGFSPLEGSYSGFQPKPAVEIILVCMKPLSEKTYVDQALKNKKGITWLDDCRVPYESKEDKEKHHYNAKGMDRLKKNYGDKLGTSFEGGWEKKTPKLNNQGRFPANLLVSDDVLNDGKVTKSTKDKKSYKGLQGTSTFVNNQIDRIQRGDFGSFSRYFDLDKWAKKTFPFLIVPKASKSEKNRGLRNSPEKIQKTTGKGIDNTKRRCPIHNEPIPSGINSYKCGCSIQREEKDFDTPKRNYHPTVKPIKLMAYLITLGSRPKDITLDPFLGSGTTAVACKELDRRFIGIEISKEYCKIAEQRLKNTMGRLL